MLETKYFRDYRHNYLIIKDNGCLLQNTYQRKMITENQIKGLLSSQNRACLVFMMANVFI